MEKEYVYDLFELDVLNNKYTYYDVRHNEKQTRHILIEKVKVVKAYYFESSKVLDGEDMFFKDFTISYSTWNELKLFEEFFGPDSIYRFNL